MKSCRTKTDDRRLFHALPYIEWRILTEGFDVMKLLDCIYEIPRKSNQFHQILRNLACRKYDDDDVDDDILIYPKSLS